MEEIVIRPARLTDMDTLLVFEQGVIATERPFDPTLGQDPIHYYDIKKMIEATHIELLVAESGNAVISSGYARIESSEPYLQHAQHAYLGFMYVLPQYRGMGINKMIVEALTRWAVSKDIAELRLEVYQNNFPAITAYEKVGFTKHMIEMRKGIKNKR